MKKIIILLLCFFISNVSADTTDKIQFCDGKAVIGRIEKVMLIADKLSVDAKIDTGADMSSLSATHIQFLKHKNKTWVKFNVFLPREHKTIILVKPMVSSAKILKRKEENETDDKSYSQRPVINLAIKVGNQTRVILVNLTDRSQFKYPMLLGNDALRQLNLLVDVNMRPTQI